MKLIVCLISVIFVFSSAQQIPNFNQPQFTLDNIYLFRMKEWMNFISPFIDSCFETHTQNVIDLPFRSIRKTEEIESEDNINLSGRTVKPTTEQPSSEEPSSEEPSSEEPSSEEPSSEEPSSEEPSSEEPSSEEPSSEEPSSEEPSSEEPSSEEPSSEEPSSEEPSSEEPSTEQPSSEEPSSEEPSTEQPSTEEPSTEEPIDCPNMGKCCVESLARFIQNGTSFSMRNQLKQLNPFYNLFTASPPKGLRVLFIDASGEAIFDTKDISERFNDQNYNTKPEVIEAIQTKKLGFASRPKEDVFHYHLAKVFFSKTRPNYHFTVRISLNDSN